MERLIACMVHAGAAFTADNGDLYSLIVQHTEGTKGYSLYKLMKGEGMVDKCGST